MNAFRHALLSTLALPALLLPALQPASAAESYDSCTGFIDSVPAVITTQGVWCLRRNLSTNISASGSHAITIAANNVTIDCNRFKLGGLAGGNGSQANGIYASDKQNATIRQCNIRGFLYGIDLVGGAGHLVEDNRLDNNLYMGIRVSGNNNLVQRNRVYDTGGAADANSAFGIYAFADVVDNTVSGLFTQVSDGALLGIRVYTDGANVSGNTVTGFDVASIVDNTLLAAQGISTNAQHVRLANNQIHGGDLSPINGIGIFVNGGLSSSGYCLGNTIGGFRTDIQCSVSHGNLVLP